MMIKLLKYYWKMSSQTFYILISCMSVIYTALIVACYRWNWNEEAVFSLGTVTAIFAIMLVYIFVMTNFHHSLKSEHRRMLPIKPIAEIGAILLQAVIYVLIVSAITIIFLLLLYIGVDSAKLINIYHMLEKPTAIASILFHIIWLTVSLLIVIMVSIAVTHSIKGKYRAWLGMAVFFAWMFIMERVMTWIFGADYNNQYLFIQFNFSVGEATTEQDQQHIWINTAASWSMMLFELSFFLLAIFIVDLLMKKRIE